MSRPGPAQLWEVGGLGASPQDRQPLPVPRCLWTALPTRVGAAGVAHAPSQGRLAQACTLPRLALVWLPWFQEAAATGAWVTPVLPGWLCAVERWRGRVRLEGDAWSLLAPKALAMLLRPRPRRRAALMGRWLSHGSRLRCSVPGPGLGLLHREQAWPSWEAVPAGPPLRFLCPALSSLLNINAGPGRLRRCSWEEGPWLLFCSFFWGPACLLGGGDATGWILKGGCAGGASARFSDLRPRSEGSSLCWG